MSPDRCGALLGLAVGDALGTTNEFKVLAAPAFPALAAGPVADIVGGGPFDLTPGQVTDDTQMACCLHQSLMSLGRFDAADVARRYVRWAGFAFDIGMQTASAIALLKNGSPPFEAGERVWKESGRRSAGNGSLMRTAPIGALLEDRDLRRRAALDDSAITHYDPRCRIACASFDAGIATGRSTGEPGLMWRAALDEIETAGGLIEADYTGDSVEVAMSVLVDDLNAATDDDPLLYGPELHLHKAQGFVRVAFRLAFWELLHADTFRAGVIDAANRGGDADTNAATAGALLGSRFGSDGIPIEWRRRVLECRADGSEAWSKTYHPRVFDCGHGA